MIRKLAGTAAVVTVVMTSLVAVTAGCGLEIDRTPVKADTTEGGDPGSTNVLGPTGSP